VIVDTHPHVVSPDTETYPRQPTRDNGLGYDAPYDTGSETATE